MIKASRVVESFEICLQSCIDMKAKCSLILCLVPVFCFELRAVNEQRDNYREMAPHSVFIVFPKSPLILIGSGIAFIYCQLMVGNERQTGI